MSVSLDSPHVFQARLVALKPSGPGAPLDLKQKFEDMSWLSYGEFAFATNFTPGAPATADVFKAEILIPLIGTVEAENPKNPAIHRIRRLYWEAYSAAAADMQRRLSPEAPEDKPAKTLQRRGLRG